ncbi:hypothetical protein PoB_005698500 [Plakobranchus ocellatus]|uniref:Uncharacterized protein n=1 Tax=Plakobranchus ocellatus TaxID=259542 RepID=A0AAV4CG50_9GAST|nr:hypothetical protein PoB_005698500 [Plakobranchus ocellatus]
MEMNTWTLTESENVETCIEMGTLALTESRHVYGDGDTDTGKESRHSQDVCMYLDPLTLTEYITCMEMDTLTSTESRHVYDDGPAVRVYNMYGDGHIDMCRPMEMDTLTLTVSRHMYGNGGDK